MRVLSAEAMRRAEQIVIENLGLPGIVLMESAAMRVVEVIMKLRSSPSNVVIAAGPGNNGGDGLAAARLLQGAGFKVSLWSTAAAGSYRDDAGINEKFLVNSKFPIYRLSPETGTASFRKELLSADLVVDALLGIGVSRPVEGFLSEIIECINESSASVLSVDIPSGVNADSGVVMGRAVKANWTVTFGYPKPGLLLYPGAQWAGEVLLGDIHLPPDIISCETAQLITADTVRKLLPPRPRNAHKGSAGRVFVVAGSRGMSGAAVLTATAALRGGAGLVYLSVPESLLPAVEGAALELVTIPLPEVATGVFSPAAAEQILQRAAKCSVIAVGPGLAESPETSLLLEKIISASPAPLILDAGALTALAGKMESLTKCAYPVVITPHLGEMARLTGLCPEEIEQSRLKTAATYARAWGCIVLLKGPNTVIATPDGELFFNPTGGPVLSTAGTGDILTGLIASFTSQGLGALDAVKAGAFIHGLAGDILDPPLGRGFTAGDVSAAIPGAFRCLKEKTCLSSYGPYLYPLREI